MFGQRPASFVTPAVVGISRVGCFCCCERVFTVVHAFCTRTPRWWDGKVLCGRTFCHFDVARLRDSVLSLAGVLVNRETWELSA